MIHSKHSQDRSYFRRERKSLSHFVLAFPLKSAQATKVSVSLNCWFQMIDIYFLFLGGGGGGEGVSVGSHYRLHTSCNIFVFSAILVVHILSFSSTSLLEWIDRDFLMNRVFRPTWSCKISTYDLWLSHYTVHVVYLLLLHHSLYFFFFTTSS